jgi:plastocyanin
MRAAVNLAAIVVLATLVSSGCSTSGDSAPPVANGIATTSAPATSAPAPDIVISKFDYAVRGPVKAGQRVTVVNDDQANHSLASNTSDAFDVRVSGGGGIATLIAPSTPGTYEFHCKYHANMHGALIVQ